MNKVYNVLDYLVTDVKEWITSMNSNFFTRGIERLTSKLEEIIEIDSGISSGIIDYNHLKMILLNAVIVFVE